MEIMSVFLLVVERKVSSLNHLHGLIVARMPGQKDAPLNAAPQRLISDLVVMESPSQARWRHL